MRAMRWPDAFPKEDIAVRNNLGGVTAKEAEELSQAWRPWRSYAVMLIWGMGSASPVAALKEPAARHTAHVSARAPVSTRGPVLPPERTAERCFRAVLYR
jgi:hypothetical protein